MKDHAAEDVERVAREIAIAELGEKDQSAIELFLPRFEKHARAALSAMPSLSEAEQRGRRQGHIEMREEAARVVEECFDIEIARAIRALSAPVSAPE